MTDEMTDKTEKTIAETKAIKIHPWWHTVGYLVIALILGAFTFLILDQLTDQINDLDSDVSAANERADTATDAVGALADQVKNLGGTPVVTPSDLPAQGEPGATGATGSPGTPGEDGTDGADGTDGTDGTNGLNGSTGKTGSQGAAGDPGEPGADGAPGSPGADGAPGQNGADGAQGPKGDTGDVGPAGPQGPAGQDGADGADGQTCPEGYTMEERDIVTTQNPLGEPGFVCVRNNDTGATPVVEENP